MSEAACIPHSEVTVGSIMSGLWNSVVCAGTELSIMCIPTRQLRLVLSVSGSESECRGRIVVEISNSSYVSVLVEWLSLVVVCVKCLS